MKKNWVKALIIILVTVGLMGVSLLGVYYVMDEKQKELEKQVLDLEQELNTRYTETELNFKINQSVEEAEEDTRQTMLKDVKEMLLETIYQRAKTTDRRTKPRTKEKIITLLTHYKSKGQIKDFRLTLDRVILEF